MTASPRPPTPVHAAFGAGLLIGLVLLGPRAAAQDAPSSLSPTDRQKSYVAVANACASETAHYCPDIDSRQLRNIAICLKPYLSNLSLGCRGSVRAVFAPAAAEPAG